MPECNGELFHQSTCVHIKIVFYSAEVDLLLLWTEEDFHLHTYPSAHGQSQLDSGLQR